jgi:hypothetical protein
MQEVINMIGTDILGLIILGTALMHMAGWC